LGVIPIANMAYISETCKRVILRGEIISGPAETRSRFMRLIQKWTDGERELLIKEYSIEPNVYKLFPNRSHISIRAMARIMGLKAKGRGFKHFNVHYFDRLNNNSAYVLGFIAADGCVHKNVLTISQNEKYILEKIACDMGFSEPYPISPVTKGGNNLQMRNQYMIDILNRYGIIERKSLILGKINVPDYLLSDFTRGYIDGDGCVSLFMDNRRSIYYFDIVIQGSYNLLHWLESAITRTTGLPHRKVRISNGRNIHSVKYSGRNAYLLHKWCYHDKAELYLERKKKVLNDYIEIYPDRQTYVYNMPCPGSKYILLGDDIVQS
jgi:hypothetical protein